VALAYLPLALPHALAFVLWTAVALACVPIAFRLLWPLTPRLRRAGDAAFLTLSFAPILRASPPGATRPCRSPSSRLCCRRLPRVGTRDRRRAVGLQLFRPQFSSRCPVLLPGSGDGALGVAAVSQLCALAAVSSPGR
jgi:hypothetical protein